MRYFSSRVTNTNNINNHMSLLGVLDSIFKGEEGKALVDKVSDNTLYFNNGYLSVDHVIYKISDGNNSIYSELKQIDGNTVLVKESMSGLNNKNIQISLEYSGKWKVNENILHNNDMKIYFYNNYYQVEKDGVKSPNIPFEIRNNGGWDFFINDESIIFRIPDVFWNNVNQTQVLAIISFADMLLMTSKGAGNDSLELGVKYWTMIDGQFTRDYTLLGLGKNAGKVGSETQNISLTSTFINNVAVPHLKNLVGLMNVVQIDYIYAEQNVYIVLPVMSGNELLIVGIGEEDAIYQ